MKINTIKLEKSQIKCFRNEMKLNVKYFRSIFLEDKKKYSVFTDDVHSTSSTFEVKDEMIRAAEPE